MANELILLKTVNADQVYFDMCVHVAPIVNAYRCMVLVCGSSHNWNWAEILFYIQLALKIVTPCLTGLAFLTGPYSGIMQELAN